MSDSRETGPHKGGTVVRGVRPPAPTLLEPPPRGSASYTPAGPPGVKVRLPGSSASVAGTPAPTGVPPRPHTAAAASGPHDAELMAGVGQTVYEFHGDAAASSTPQHPADDLSETFYGESNFVAGDHERRDTNLRGSRLTWVIASLVVVVAGGLAIGMSAFAPAADEPAPPLPASPSAADVAVPSSAVVPPAASESGLTAPSAAAAPAAGQTDGTKPPVDPATAASVPASGGSKSAPTASASEPQKKPPKSKPKKKKKKKKKKTSSSGIKPKKPPRKGLDDLPPPPGG